MTSAAPPYRYVGHSVLRREGADKVTGRAIYIDDRATPGCLHAKTLRSTIPAGRIRAIHFPPHIPWHEFTIADARDLAENVVALILDDQPVFCDGIVRHLHEPILVLAHPDHGKAEEAVRAIRVDYDEEPGVFDIGPGPVMKSYRIDHGEIDAAFAESDVVLEGTYQTGAQEHVYIEPNGFIAEWKNGVATLRGSLQCPYYVHKAVMRALGLPAEKVNVIQETTGGGFGGKEDFPSVLGIHAALLARKSGKTIRLMYNRNEDMASSTKRHPSRSLIRTGCSRDGKLLALDFEFLIDGGAYSTLSAVVLSRGILHGSGPYRWKAARLVGHCHFTNSPPYGAFRGFGAPQSQFAIELHLSRLADQLGIDPAELRRRNFLHRGDVLPTGQILAEDPNLEAMLDRALDISDYHEKRKKPRGGGSGVGVSATLHGTGFTGNGEVYLASKVAVEARADGKATILVASTEIGQGTETIFSQMVAEALGIPIGDVVFHRPETDRVPNSGPTVASRTCSVVGRLVQRAAEQLRDRLSGASIADHVRRHGVAREEAVYTPPPGLVWNEDSYRGSAYGAYSWAIMVAETTVDPVTRAPKVEAIWNTTDVGTIINPVLAIGQMEGGIAQAVGWATCEQVVLRKGAMANGQMTNYIIPTSADAPSIVVEFIENPYAEGAYGSKGVGELPMDGPASAIVAAINHAADAGLAHIPATPEDLLS